MPSNGISIFEANADEGHILSSGVESGGSEDEGSTSANNKNRYNTVTASLKESDSSVAAASTMDASRFTSLPNRSRHEKFLRTFVEEVMQTAVFNATERDQKVVEWTNPEELLEKLDLDLKNEPDTDDKLMELARDTIKYSVKTGHPYFVNQLFSAVDAYALAGQWLTDALNPSVYTYEVAPVFILMEEVVLKEMRQIVGWTDGKGDGIFSPGGSIANGYAIQCARFHFMPEVKVSYSYNYTIFLKGLLPSRNCITKHAPHQLYILRKKSPNNQITYIKNLNK